MTRLGYARWSTVVLRGRWPVERDLLDQPRRPWFSIGIKAVLLHFYCIR